MGRGHPSAIRSKWVRWALPCEGRSADQALVIGSVKTNVGHLEAAAVSRALSVIIALQSARIPPNLHFRKGNPHIDWAMWPIRVPTTAMPAEPIEGRRIAGVSSFGFGGEMRMPSWKRRRRRGSRRRVAQGQVALSRYSPCPRAIQSHSLNSRITMKRAVHAGVAPDLC